MFCVVDADGDEYHFFEGTPDNLCTCGLWKKQGEIITRAHPDKYERYGYATEEKDNDER